MDSQEVLRALSDPSIAPELHRIAHLASDKDQGYGALHHTLGSANGQALPRSVADEDYTSSDDTYPNPPSGLTVTASKYFDATGLPRARANFAWVAPTTNTDTSALTDLSYYETQWKINGGTVWHGSVQTDAEEVFYDNFNPGDYVDFRVRAVDTSTNKSDWAEILHEQMSVDSSAPVTPSTPTLDASTFFGMIRVIWDGLDNLGNPQDSDFARVEVHASTSSGFTPDESTLRDTLFSAAVSDVFGDVGSTLYIKLVAYDTSGNFSSPSAQVNATILGVDTPDYINLSVVDAKINTLTVSKLTAGTLSADVTVSARIKTADSGARSEMDSAGFHVYNASGIEVAYMKIVAGVPAIYIDGGTIEGSTVTGGTIRTAASGLRVELSTSDVDMIRLYTGESSETVSGFVSAGFGGSLGHVSVAAPSFGLGTARIDLYSPNTGGTIAPWINITADRVTLDGFLYFDGTIQDVDLTNDGQPITVGEKVGSGTQLIIDNNEIQCRVRNAGNTAWSAANLSLQANGGNVNLSAASQIGSATVQAYGQSVCVGPSSLTRPYEVNGDSASYTTNGSGQVTINHGLGGTPTSVVAVSGNGSNSRWMAIDALGATSFRVTVFNTAGIVNSTSVPIKWIAFR